MANCTLVSDKEGGPKETTKEWEEDCTDRITCCDPDTYPPTKIPVDCPGKQRMRMWQQRWVKTYSCIDPCTGKASAYTVPYTKTGGPEKQGVCLTGNDCNCPEGWLEC